VTENEFFNDVLETPIGLLEVVADHDSVLGVDFTEKFESANPNSITQLVITQLSEYFEGKRKSFDLPLAPRGTQFQQQVWRALLTVDYACACSYSDIAELVKNPKGVRAVGAANGKNPISVIIPCHRVIGKDGSLTGYAGGVDRKQWLLQHEQKHGEQDYSLES